jgi:hypothetical protein
LRSVGVAGGPRFSLRRAHRCFLATALAQSPVDPGLAAFIATIKAVDNHTHAHSTAPDDADSNALPLEGLDGRQLETIRILTAEGSSKTICFDITSFFGEP